MNKILNLKGDFEKRKNINSNIPQLPRLNSSEFVSVDMLLRIKEYLNNCKEYYKNNKYTNGLIISVLHTRVIAKSKRISAYFANSFDKCNEKIVGVKFNNKQNKHIITYFISNMDIDECLVKLNKCINIINDYCNGTMYGSSMSDLIDNKSSIFQEYKISKTQFAHFVCNTLYIDKIYIEEIEKEDLKNSIISFYNTNFDLNNLLSRFNIKKSRKDFLDDYTVFLAENELDKVINEVPYLISMATSDFARCDYESLNIVKDEITIPEPNNEPVVGVIDTLFSNDVYFNQWVEYHDTFSDEVPKDSRDYKHGTSVTSIIVDGPSINPALDDGCGRFRVRHFGVSLSSRTSSFEIIKKIIEIIKNNKDIKVWNLSLGSKEEISNNFISPEGYILDKLQSEYNVIFIIAGTNDSNDSISKRIGSPADSVNSIVVNSIDSEGARASYSRGGPVLSFFIKPDVCCFGGDSVNPIRTCNSFGENNTYGTSFAAPWITRKMAYLIEILKLPKEVAKALLIDSATKWSGEVDYRFKGYGAVPIHIDNVIKSNDAEIKFYFYQNAEMYDTYTTNIPVPCIKDSFPYFAKATLVYFPMCSRNQGIDYTNTELSFSFGRINGEEIKKITDEFSGGIKEFISEDELRRNYRKWDNIKIIKDEIKDRARPRVSYGSNKNWGISVKKTNRFSSKEQGNIKFGLVVTLKEMNNVNRISEFIKNANFAGWLVKEIDSEVYNIIHNKAEEEIQFE